MDSDVQPVVTLVLRLWRAGRCDFRYQATHVQTGEIAYFRTIAAVLGYVDDLSDRLSPRAPREAPLRFPTRRTAHEKGIDRDV
jgi:hypothetical protein